MKNQVKTIVKGAVFSLILLTGIGFFNNVNAQEYGGSAYAYVQDGNGNTRVINQTTVCVYSSQAKAKSQLESYMNAAKYSYEVFISANSYDIDSCD